MNSRVVHVRLTDGDVARCYSVGEVLSLPPEPSVSTTVARVLSLLLDSAGIEVPTDPAAYVAEKAQAERAPEQPQPPEEDEDFELFPVVPVGEMPPTQPPPPPIAASPPWEGHTIVPFRLIASECPKDRFVEAVLELEEPDSYLVRAVEITYAVLGRDQWGSLKAGEMIAQLMQRFHEFAEQTGERL